MTKATGNSVDSVLDQLSGRVLLAREELVKITGSVQAAMFVSQALYWQRVKGADEWFWKTNEEWAAELWISVRTFAKLKEQMRGSGLVEMTLRGVPAKSHYRVNIALLLERVRQCNSSCAHSAQQAVQKVHNKLCKNGTTNTKSTAENSAKKFPFGKQAQSARTSLPDIIEEFQHVSPSPANADRCFRKLWVHANTGRPLIAATNKRMAMLGNLCSRLGERWAEVLAATVAQWEVFCGQVALDKDIRHHPKIPVVEFMCTHADVMLAMSLNAPAEQTGGIVLPKHQAGTATSNITSPKHLHS